MGITLRTRAAHSPWRNGKIETQNQHIARNWLVFFIDAGNNWSSSAPKFAHAHNTSKIYITRETPSEKVFETKPQIPMFLKLELYRQKHKLYFSDFCKNLPPHSHCENNLNNQYLYNLLRAQPSQTLLVRERLLYQFRKMPRANHLITCLPEPVHIGTPPCDRTNSSLPKSSARRFKKPKLQQ